jgi:endoglucanase
MLFPYLTDMLKSPAISIGTVLRSLPRGLRLAGALLPLCVGAMETPWLHVNGNWLNDPQGNRVVLRGVAVVTPKDHAARGGIAAVVDRVTEPNLYSRVVRVPVHPTDWTGQAYVDQYLKPCVDALTKKGVYVIIDLHYISAYGSLDAKVKDFWSVVAPAFKDYSNVLYEVFNEPTNPGGQSGWPTWKAAAQPWVDLIRAAAPKNPILVGSPTWSQDARFAVTDPFKGDNLIYVIHVYPIHTNWDQMFGVPSTKIPIFLSEWGYQNAGSFGSEVKGTTSVYGAQMKAYLAAHPNVSSTAWVFDHSWYPVMCDRNYKLLGGEDYQGEFVQAFLSEKRNDDLPGSGSSIRTRLSGKGAAGKPQSYLSFGLPPGYFEPGAARGRILLVKPEGLFNMAGRIQP